MHSMLNTTLQRLAGMQQRRPAPSLARSGGACLANHRARRNAQTLGLVFVAVYQKALKLLYVDALLEQVKQVCLRHAPGPARCIPRHTCHKLLWHVQV